MKKLSPAVKLMADAVQSLVSCPLAERIVLNDKKNGVTAIAYHGDKGDNTIIGVIKQEVR